MSGAFVITVGRSGSTLLTRMLQRHSELCSISEYWTCLYMRSYGNPTISGATYWKILSDVPHWYTTLIDKSRAADSVPSEFIYDETRGRYNLRNCPPLLTMTLPALFDRPDDVFTELSAIIPAWPKRPISEHSRHLFTWLCDRTGRPTWIERSGFSYWYLPDLMTGFPDAKYVHLIRDGREVVLSMMGMRLFDPVVRASWMMSIFKGNRVRRGIYFSYRNLGRRLLLRTAQLDRTLTRQHRRARPYSVPDRLDAVRRAKAYAVFWANTTELALEALEAVAPEARHSVRYESLVDDPRSVSGALVDFLRPGADHSAWIDDVAAMPSRRQGRWPTIDPEVADAIETIVAPMNRQLGYS
ncbi:MAG: sulfotransferase [Devosia sp.]